MSAVYLHEWADDGFIGMVADFEGIHMNAKEFAATVTPYANENFWRQNKAHMQEALSLPKYQGMEVLLASYGSENYGGDAFVLFERNGKLWEVNGSHCSCHGLGEEGPGGPAISQWVPEATSINELRHRLDAGTLGREEYHGNVFADELRQVISAYTAPAVVFPAYGTGNQG